MIGSARRLLTNDPRDDRSLILGVGTAILVVAALAMRLLLTPFVDPDYAVYLSPWYDHLAQFGLRGFREKFSDYNFPYLFLMYLSTWLPVAKIVAIKLPAICFDFVLALSVHAIVRRLTGDATRAVLVATASLFLPTVFLNSSLWGQSDAIYVTFTLQSLLFVLRRQMLWSWTFFAVAVAFKLQAIFFLPLLAYVWMKKVGPWYAPLVAIPTFLVLSLPPVAFGRSWSSTLGVYAHQYGAQPLLAVSAPNIYYWVPATLSDLLTKPALMFSGALTGLLLVFSFLRLKLTSANLVLLSALFLLIVPFSLPQMHERYFYGFEILCLLIAALDFRKLWLVVVSQCVAFFSYSSFLFETHIVPWPYLSMITLVLVAYFLYLLVQAAAGRGFHDRALRPTAIDPTT